MFFLPQVQYHQASDYQSQMAVSRTVLPLFGQQSCQIFFLGQPRINSACTINDKHHKGPVAGYSGYSVPRFVNDGLSLRCEKWVQWLQVWVWSPKTIPNKPNGCEEKLKILPTFFVEPPQSSLFSGPCSTHVDSRSKHYFWVHETPCIRMNTCIGACLGPDAAGRLGHHPKRRAKEKTGEKSQFKLLRRLRKWSVHHQVYNWNFSLGNWPLSAAWGVSSKHPSCFLLYPQAAHLRVCRSFNLLPPTAMASKPHAGDQRNQVPIWPFSCNNRLIRKVAVGLWESLPYLDLLRKPGKKWQTQKTSCPKDS